MKEPSVPVLLAWILVCGAASADMTAQNATNAETALAELDQKLAKHPFFARIDFEKETKHAPFVFYVQRPDKADSLYLRAVVNTYKPFLQKLLEVFEATYAQPLNLPRHATVPVFTIAVLSSRGAYDDYARATRSPSLHRARAHYDPMFRIAVTYKDTFSDDPGGANIDDRHSLLHEMVHALQHAYSTDAQMPTGLWFVEGLAEYRSSCGHLPEHLTAPELNNVTMQVLAMVAGQADLRHHVVGLKDLLGMRTYADVVKAANLRAPQAAGEVNAELALSAFYAQSSMLVRFLHEGEKARYLPNFLKFMQHAMRGATSAAAWAEGFGDIDLAELDRQFRAWLSDTIRDVGGLAIDDLAPRVSGDRKVVMAALSKSDFDRTTLAWQPQDEKFRIEAARQLCAAGDCEAALAVLPAEATATDSAKKERERIDAVRALRERVIADVVKSKQEIELDVEGKATRVRLVRAEADGVVAISGKQETKLPVSVLRPSVLLAHCWRKNWLAGPDLWLDRWLRWLSGAGIEKLRPMLAGTDAKLVALRADLQQTLVDDQGMRSLAALLHELQNAPLPEARADATKLLTRLQEIARAYAAQPVFQARRSALSNAARVLAERAFAAEDPTSLGLTGAVAALPDSRFRVVYEGVDHAAFDLKLEQDYLQRLPEQPVKIAYDGAPVLRSVGKQHELLGEGFFRWLYPLSGKVVVELDQSQNAVGQLELVLCDDREGSHVAASPFGFCVFDLRSSPPLIDQVGQGTRRYYPDKVYRVRFEHDGVGKARVLLDGKELAPWRSVGTRGSGWLGLYVFASNPMMVHRLAIEGSIDNSQIAALRERFVAAMVAKVESAGR